MEIETTQGPCLTCYGTGETVSEAGPSACPDCYGDGKPASRGTRMEWRLRDIERAQRPTGREGESEVLWLVHELRRSREALTRIVARCEDGGGAVAELAFDVKHIANAVLGLYDPKP
jgi:hypothetical protein